MARLLAAIFAKFHTAGIRVERAEVNGQPGAEFVDRDDRVVAVTQDTAEDRVQCVRSVVDPEKLGAPRAHIGLPDATVAPRRGGLVVKSGWPSAVPG